MIRVRLLAAATAATAAALLLAGCTSNTTEPAAPVAPTSTATGKAAATPTAQPTLAPSGSAADNKAYFSLVTKRLLAKTKAPTGRQLIDNLVDAGFDKADMEVTPDKTAIGLTADAIEFSVKFTGECLVGQKGEAFGFTVKTLPVLDTGTCLVGKTRTIDW